MRRPSAQISVSPAPDPFRQLFSTGPVQLQLVAVGPQAAQQALAQPVAAAQAAPADPVAAAQAALDRSNAQMDHDTEVCLNAIWAGMVAEAKRQSAAANNKRRLQVSPSELQHPPAIQGADGKDLMRELRTVKKVCSAN